MRPVLERISLFFQFVKDFSLAYAWEVLVRPQPKDHMVLDVPVGTVAPGRIADGTIPLLTVWLMFLKKQNGNGTSNLDIIKHLSKSRPHRQSQRQASERTLVGDCLVF